MTTSLSWRATHHWLRGYSDAKGGKPCVPLSEEYADDYKRGHFIGGGGKAEPAYDTTGREQCQA